MKRTYRYMPDGTSYEVTKAPPKPRVFFHGLTQAHGSDGKEISQSELKRLNAQGKNLHIEEIPNISQDAHNETIRQTQIDKVQRKEAIADAVKGHGL